MTSCIPNEMQPRKAEAPWLPQPLLYLHFCHYLARPAIAAVPKRCQVEACKEENGNGGAQALPLAAACSEGRRTSALRAVTLAGTQKAEERRKSRQVTGGPSAGL